MAPETLVCAPASASMDLHTTGSAAPIEPGQASAGQAPDQQAAAASAQPAVDVATPSQERVTSAAPAAAAPKEPGQASVGQPQDQQASAASAQPAASAAAASRGREVGAAPAAVAPKEPGQASVGGTPGQQAPAVSAQPAASAAAASQGRAADTAPAAEECRPLRPHEQKVAAALLVVLRTALKEGGAKQLTATKLILMANNPLTSPLLEQLPDDGNLPSLKQLERLAALAPTYWMGRRPNQGRLPGDWMDVLAEHCASAGFEPLDVYRRSIECMTHIRALHSNSKRSGAIPARLQRLRAIEASLALRRPAQPDGEEIHQAIAVKIGLLSPHEVPRRICDLISELLYLVVILLYADKLPENRSGLTAGARTSFTVCIDHMLPGVLDALIEHGHEDLTSVDALLAMVAPLEHALQSYRDRAAAKKWNPSTPVHLDAAVQGWSRSIAHCKDFLNTLIQAVDLRPMSALPDIPAYAGPTVEEVDLLLTGQTTLSLHCQEILQVIEIAFHPGGGLGCTNYRALCQILPGFTFPSMSDDGKHRILEVYTMQTAMVVKQQIQVHKHIASLQKVPLGVYLKKLLVEQLVDTGQEVVQAFCKVACRAAELSGRLGIAMARRVHISMTIKTTLYACRNQNQSVLLTLLDKLMSLVCTEGALTPQFVRAIHQALPGVMDSLSGLHTWPKGHDRDLVWLGEAMQLLSRILTQHARRAQAKGIPPKEHVRNVLRTPGLRDAEAEPLMAMFKDFWAGKTWELNAPSPAAQTPTQQGSCASPSVTPADSGTGAEKQASKATAKGAAAEVSRKATQACEVRQQGDAVAADAAADVIEGVSTETQDTEGGGSTHVRGEEEAAGPQNGLNEAEKAEKRKAKKARQRAARAQAAAQTAQVKGMGRKEPDLAESTGSISLQKRTAETESAERPPQADQFSSEPVSPTPEELVALKAPAQSDEVPGGSRSSSLSPQPSQQLGEHMSLELHAHDLPSQAAPGAQAAAPAAHDDGTWQEVRGHRRKSVRQQRASSNGAARSPKQGRGTPDQGTSAPSPTQPRELQAVAQHAEQAPLNIEQAAGPSRAEPVHVAAENMPGWLSTLVGSKPQQPPQHEGQGFVQPPLLQDRLTHSTRPRPLMSPDTMCRDGAHPAPLHTLRSPGSSFAIPSHEQAANTHEHPSREDTQHYDDDLCVVCWENVRKVVFCHCGHMCTCEGCAGDIMAAGALCPMCRAKIHSTVMVYF